MVLFSSISFFWKFFYIVSRFVFRGLYFRVWWVVCWFDLIESFFVKWVVLMEGFRYCRYFSSRGLEFSVWFVLLYFSEFYVYGVYINKF